MNMDTLGNLLRNEEFGEIWAKHRNASLEYIDGNPTATFYVMRVRAFLPFLMRIHLHSIHDLSTLTKGLKICLRNKIPALFVRTNHGPISLESTEYEVHYTRVIDLSASLRRIYDDFEKDTRRLVNKARNEELEVEIAETKLQFESWWKMYLKLTEKRPIMQEKHAHVFELYQNKFAELFLAYFKGEAIAGALIVLNGKGALWWLGAYDDRFTDLRPNHLLQWEIIKWLKGKNYVYYDMGGIIRNSKHGPSLFKKGFGGLVTAYYTYKFELNPIQYRIIDFLIRSKFKLTRKW